MRFVLVDELGLHALVFPHEVMDDNRPCDVELNFIGRQLLQELFVATQRAAGNEGHVQLPIGGFLHGLLPAHHRLRAEILGAVCGRKGELDLCRLHLPHRQKEPQNR